MNCYICNQNGGAGGTRYGISDAVGICQECGIGLCAHHGQRESNPRARLLCPNHAVAVGKPMAQEKVLVGSVAG